MNSNSNRRTIRSGAASVTVQRDSSSVWTITDGPEAVIGERWHRLDDLRQSLRHRGFGNFRKSFKG